MLKKAGIVVATAAVGLLAVSPLAFAGESHGKGHGHGTTTAKDVDVASSSIQKDSQGLINALNSNNVTVSPQICNIDVVKVADNINALAGAAGAARLRRRQRATTLSGTRACAPGQTSAANVSAANED